MTVTTAEVGAWLGAFLWPFMRVGALFLTAPLFGNTMVPVRVRVFAGAALTVAVMPAVGPVPAVDPLSLEALLVAVQQVLIGVAMGLLLSLAFQAVTIAGEAMSLNMGLGFATMADPQSGVSTPVLGQFLLILSTLLFLSIGGHLLLVEVLAESFRSLPVDQTGLTRQDFVDIAFWGARMFAGGVLIALPAIAVLLTAQMLLGVMTRTAPQMNIFSVGFPITILLGLVSLLVLVVPYLTPRMTELWREAFAMVRQILGG